MKRTFDDDLREVLSDEEEKKSPKKQAKLQSQKQGEKNIAIEKEEKRITDIHEIDEIIRESLQEKIEERSQELKE